ncbi:MBL fold metallo-hydrolase [Dyadobacter subterraneus]|uniref:MBL fold metallo-hydrolase n=1 Tax=Dyadobacter subterraneus TaxID=2773304 RepID=A0ABR9W7Y3_9BACT|nr:MBL fold metallo-hydrolase [Dyadobacter subterraneus]MBE9461576.1 MBL fold metallo-hydrolase [Dyadobacter subterraneus]
MKNPASQYLNNPDLKTPKAPQDWSGTPVDGDGRFRNLNHTFSANMTDVFRWKFQRNPFKKQKHAEIWNPEIFRDNSWLEKSDDIIVWLGHSTFYIRVNGIKILTDPVFGDILSVKRRSEFPIDFHRLINLDYILLSHDHRDHLDKKSLNILSKQNPDVRYLTGLHMKEIVKEFTQSGNIEEAGWYQQYNTDNQPVNITFIPSRHWSKRGLFDTNLRLWGGFVIEAENKRILFGGDSGYDTHYQQLADVFGSFDFAILGIGAYAPEWFMSPNHQSPKDALKAFTQLNAKYFIPMHYGTFDLSDEPLGEPLRQLLAEAKNQNLEDKLIISQIGKPVSITGSKRSI